MRYSGPSLQWSTWFPNILTLIWVCCHQEYTFWKKKSFCAYQNDLIKKNAVVMSAVIKRVDCTDLTESSLRVLSLVQVCALSTIYWALCGNCRKKNLSSHVGFFHLNFKCWNIEIVKFARKAWIEKKTLGKRISNSFTDEGINMVVLQIRRDNGDNLGIIFFISV